MWLFLPFFFFFFYFYYYYYYLLFISHYKPSINIFKKIVAFDKFIDRNETKINLSSCSRIEKSSYYHKSEISEDGNYLASINKDGLL